jgi:alkanesulfonate monooxygenase SsuD/methylene tetrahydromethanopterin reductase-like flavin-dependent oxidoreductase (luciferase family)
VDFDALRRDRFLPGSSDEVAEQILQLHRRTGTNHVIGGAGWPGMPQSLVLATIATLGIEVFPRVRQGR